MKGIHSVIFTSCFIAFAFANAASPQMKNQQTVKINNHNVTISESQPLLKLARFGAKSYGYRATDLSVDSDLAELLRLRVSQINHCSYCLNIHYQAARDMKIPQIKIDTLEAWWATDLYTDAEKAALTYSEALTRLDNDAISKQIPNYHQQLAKYYSKQQIVEIAGIVINMNIWTRLKPAEGAMPSIDQQNKPD